MRPFGSEALLVTNIKLCYSQVRQLYLSSHNSHKDLTINRAVDQCTAAALKPMVAPAIFRKMYEITDHEVKLINIYLYEENANHWLREWQVIGSFVCVCAVEWS